MKILMLVPFLPNTQTSGGQTRWYNIVKFLSERHEITLFSLIKDESERRFIPELNKYCKKVEVFNRPSSPWAFRNLFLSIFSPFPLLLIRNFSFKERRAVRDELKNGNYDLIHAEAFYVMPHIPTTHVPSIQVEQTIWHRVYEHHVKTEVNPILRPFLINDVWPKIHEKYNSAKLWIVGRMIPESIVDLSKKRDDIKVTESIPDPRDAYLGASVMTAPIKGSGGTRIKILEAMAAGLPVVSTSIGVAGLNLTNNKHALISDTAEGLAMETVKLLKNPKLSRKIGK